MNEQSLYPIRFLSPAKSIFAINLFRCFLLLSCGLIAACSPDGPEESPLEGAYYPITLGDKTLQVQLALLPEEHNKGLMYRDTLGKDQGVLFVLDKPSRYGFWMKNTSIPLDIGFFDAGGHLAEIQSLVPYIEKPVNSQSFSTLMALEVNQCWFTENGISRGSQLNLDELFAAIKARGFSPEDYTISLTE